MRIYVCTYHFYIKLFCHILSEFTPKTDMKMKEQYIMFYPKPYMNHDHDMTMFHSCYEFIRDSVMCIRYIVTYIYN